MKNKVYTIRYLQTFNEDLIDILNYITYKFKSKEIANSFLNRVEKAILDRATMPKSYQKYYSIK